MLDTEWGLDISYQIRFKFPIIVEALPAPAGVCVRVWVWGGGILQSLDPVDPVVPTVLGP